MVFSIIFAFSSLSAIGKYFSNSECIAEFIDLTIMQFFFFRRPVKML